MNKRIKKKQGTNYNHLKFVKRQMHNRLGLEKYMDFEIIPMGEQDAFIFKGKYHPDFQLVDYWFVELSYEKLPDKFVVVIYPCTRNGRINQRNGFLSALTFKKLEDVLAVFEQLIGDMKDDCYMENFDSYYYEDLLFKER